MTSGLKPWLTPLPPPTAQLLPADLREDGADRVRGRIQHPRHGLCAAAQPLQLWTRRHGAVQRGVTCAPPCWVCNKNPSNQHLLIFLRLQCEFISSVSLLLFFHIYIKAECMYQYRRNQPKKKIVKLNKLKWIWSSECILSHYELWRMLPVNQNTFYLESRVLFEALNWVFPRKMQECPEPNPLAGRPSLLSCVRQHWPLMREGKKPLNSVSIVCVYFCCFSFLQSVIGDRFTGFS